MKTYSDEKAEAGLLDSKIRGRLQRSIAVYNPPPDGKQQLLRAVMQTPEKKAIKFWDTLVDFFMQTEDPDSVALLQTFALSKAQVFGLPGSQSLHMI